MLSDDAVERSIKKLKRKLQVTNDIYFNYRKRWGTLFWKRRLKLIMQTRLVNAWETLNSNCPWGLFLKSPEASRAYFGCHKSSRAFEQPAPSENISSDREYFE